MSSLYMRSALFGFLAHMLLCLIMPAAWAAPANDLPVLPPSLLVDQTGTLSAAERDGLSQRLQAIQASGQAQMAILIAGDIGSEPLAAYSLRVAEAWQLGNAGRNDGLLILVIPSRNAVRIEVGYGLEGVIPDARASRWLDDLVPALRNKTLVSGLHRLLDQIDGALPGKKETSKPTPQSGVELLEAHPEWVLPFFLLVAAPMTLIPLFVMRRGHLISGPLLALVLGLAVWAIWGLRPALPVAACALPLPYLWSLNSLAGPKPSLAPWQVYARHFGNGIAVLMLFCVCAIVVGTLLPAGMMYRWIAVLIALIFAISLAAFLFPGKPGRYLSQGVSGAMLFTFFAVVAYFALQPLVAEPTMIALAIAGALTALLGITLYLDSAEKQRADSGQRNSIQWSLVLCCVSLLAVVPFALLALVRAATGDDWHRQLVEAVSGSGALTGVAWLAARVGLFTALQVGLGGLFGGGGAGRD